MHSFVVLVQLVLPFELMPARLAHELAVRRVPQAVQLQFVGSREDLSALVTFVRLGRVEDAHVLANAGEVVVGLVALRAVVDACHRVGLGMRAKGVNLVETFMAERTFVVFLIAVRLQVAGECRVVHESFPAKLLENMKFKIKKYLKV